MADTELAAFRKKFRLDELILLEEGGWVLSLRPVQLTLGAMVLSLGSGRQDLAGLSAAEGQGLVAGLGRAGRLARVELGADRINALCLMMQEPVVHFHLLPRFLAPREYAGATRMDADWPGPPVMRPAPAEEGLLRAVQSGLKAALAQL